MNKGQKPEDWRGVVANIDAKIETGEITLPARVVANDAPPEKRPKVKITRAMRPGGGIDRSLPVADRNENS